VEASALQAPVGLARNRVSISLPLLRLRSDDQLVALFRAGYDEAFRAIHDRYRQRLFAYTRQMLPASSPDAEDVLQDVFVRAYAGLRASDRELALRAWLYRVAHNRCIDELRRPPQPAPDMVEVARIVAGDPIAAAEQRETLRRLIEDVRRLPEQQRSALLMRELSGMSYQELAVALSVSVPAVKSLLVRARVGLAKAAEARETACTAIREELVVAHDRGVRPSGVARRHLRDCPGCSQFRGDVRSLSRQFAALTPALAPAAVLAKLVGLGSGASAGSGAATGTSAAAGGGVAAAGGGVALAGGAAGTGGVLAAGGLLATGATHVATLLAAAVITAGGAVEIGNTISPPLHHHARRHVVSAPKTPRVAETPPAQPADSSLEAVSVAATAASTDVGAAPSDAVAPSAPADPAPARHRHAAARTPSQPVSLDQGTFGLPSSVAPARSDTATSGGTGGTAAGTGTSSGTGAPSSSGPNATGATGATTGTGPGAAGETNPIATVTSGGGTTAGSPTGATGTGSGSGGGTTATTGSPGSGASGGTTVAGGSAGPAN
jgi:RNA polymerase sigma factor (sigma-70 family)